MGDLALETVDQLVLRQAALLEEALHQSVVALRDFLDQRGARFVRLALHVSRDIRRLEFS